MSRVVGVLSNKPPAIQFHYKFEFILCKNWGTSYKDIKAQLLVVDLVVVFPGTVFDQRIHFVVQM